MSQYEGGPRVACVFCGEEVVLRSHLEKCPEAPADPAKTSSPPGRNVEVTKR